MQYRQCAQCGQFSVNCKVDTESGNDEFRCPPCFAALRAEHKLPENNDVDRLPILRTSFGESLALHTFLSDGSEVFISLDEETATAVVQWKGKNFYEVPYEADGILISFDPQSKALPERLLDLLP